tara:strand:+ start:31 stop:360 length:330 start_codon:yes stop_codon:yes gene_type:complete
MGKKRRLLSGRNKFNSKHSNHPVYKARATTETNTLEEEVVDTSTASNITETTVRSTTSAPADAIGGNTTINSTGDTKTTKTVGKTTKTGTTKTKVKKAKKTTKKTTQKK